jgi:hypothetical protein
MPTDNEPPKNPFIRFKKHVDANIGAGVHGILSLPTMISDSFHGRQLGPQAVGAASFHHGFNDSFSYGHPDSDRWLAEQRRASETEAWLDNMFEGYGEMGQLRRWQIFIYESPYSPIRLASTMPRQPCPRDLEPGMDPTMFTFVDAFEDLLLVSSGRPMMDLCERYDMNRTLARMYPTGEHPFSWFSRLQSQGLSRSYFQDKHRSAREPEDEWGRMMWKDDSRQEGETRETAPTGVPQPPIEQDRRDEHQRDFFGELDRVFKHLGKVLQDEISSSPFGNKKTIEDSKDASKREPNTEMDLYDTVRSAYNEAERSLSTFIKSFSQGKLGFDDDQNPGDGTKPSTIKPVTETQEDESGKTVKSTKEWKDIFGNSHVKTEIRKTDRSGNVVSTETHYSIQSRSEDPKTWRRSSDESLPDNDGEEMSDTKQNERRRPGSGWFWK